MTSPPDATCWTLIRDAAAGDPRKREEFARRYAPLLRTYFASLRRTFTVDPQIEDAVQEVFMECFRRGGVLDRAETGHPGGFRAFLYGVVRNVGSRVSARVARERQAAGAPVAALDDVESSDASLSRAFDRSWALARVREAAGLQESRAGGRDEDARRRVELLRLRFFEDLPIREIAARWNADPARLHHEYAKAREEFREALHEIVAFDHPGTPGEIERRCLELLAALRTE